MGDRKQDAKGRSKKSGRYVAIFQSMMETLAWQELSCAERCVYMEIKRRYGGPGTNNGRISCSVRELSDRLGIGKTTASRALARLQELGFVRQTKKGAFSVKCRMASEWEITEEQNDMTRVPATRAYQRWEPEKQNTVPC